MLVNEKLPELVAQKLEMVQRLQPEFERWFHFKQDVHGQRRFAFFSIEEIVAYLHALWMCELKDRLLSVYKTTYRYEGQCCLKMLQTWQTGENAQVVAFLSSRLDMLPLTEITVQLEQARATHQEWATIQRLSEGRLVLLNRGMNLFHALDALFKVSEEALQDQVRAACAQFHHTPEQIEAQLLELEGPLYASVPHQALARQNMIMMNRLATRILGQPSDQAEERSSSTRHPRRASGTAYADQIIAGYVPLRSLL